MMLQGNGNSSVVCEVTLRRQDQDWRWRERLLAHVRPHIERALRSNPDLPKFDLAGLFGTIEVRTHGCPYRPGVPLELRFQADEQKTPADGVINGSANLVTVLPDYQTTELAARLIGLNAIRNEVLLRWYCKWDGQLHSWTTKHSQRIPSALQAHLSAQHALTIFAGDPGTGKSALARVIANQYCIDRRIPGQLFELQTDVRGNGLVGDFGNRLRRAFDSLSGGSRDELRCLIIDEADAVAMRRSEGQSHQEDRAGTATMLQCLDALGGKARVAIFMTTNLLSTIDPAIGRRAITHYFRRPDTEARRKMLSTWLPGAAVRSVDSLTRASCGMTPADIEKALSQAYLSAVLNDQPLQMSMVRAALKAAPRTEAM